jgi:hypothetical protein
VALGDGLTPNTLIYEIFEVANSSPVKSGVKYEGIIPICNMLGMRVIRGCPV